MASSVSVVLSHKARKSRFTALPPIALPDASIEATWQLLEARHRAKAMAPCSRKLQLLTSSLARADDVANEDAMAAKPSSAIGLLVNTSVIRLSPPPNASARAMAPFRVI